MGASTKSEKGLLPDGEAARGATRGRARSARHVGDPPRRTMAAGHVWLVGLVALVVGALLNAPGIQKTALGQPVGWRRDVATFFADPLYDVSHTLGLDRARLGLQEILGRSGDDDIDLSLPSPEPSGEIPIAEIPQKVAFSPSHQMSLWVGGDSLAINPGESIINQAIATQVIGITDSVDGHVSTGLARPEVFNWPAYLADVVARLHPTTIVLTLGSNDDQPLTGENGVGEFGTDAWQAEYHRRVGGLMDQVTGDGTITLFWVGIPPVRNTARFDNGYRLVNEIARAEATKRRGRVFYIDTVPVLAGPDTGYADYLTNPDGSVVRVRTPDGIHFERAGSDRIASAVLAAMHTVFDLTSWQTTTTTAPTTTTTTTRPGAKKQPATGGSEPGGTEAGR